MNGSLELKHLRAFAVLAGELHFGQAALDLGIAQPALSQRIRQMEDLLELRLFERTSRQVALTEAGAAFLPRVRELLDRLERDVEEAKRVARGETGRLDLAFITSAGVIVSEHLQGFSVLRPDVQVRLSNGDTTQVLEQLRRGTCDIGIVRDAEAEDGILLSTLSREDFVAVLPEHHPAAAGPEVNAAGLLGSPLILFPRSSGPRALDLNLKPFRDLGVERRPDQECTEWHTIIQLVSRGLGITIAPRSVTGELPVGAVLRELTGPGRYTSEVQLATRDGDHRAVVTAFRQAAGVL